MKAPCTLAKWPSLGTGTGLGKIVDAGWQQVCSVLLDFFKFGFYRVFRTCLASTRAGLA